MSHDPAEVRRVLADDWCVVCVSHLPWQETLLQRPHQWMRRFAAICPTVWIAPASWKRFTAKTPPDDRLATRSTGPNGLVVRHLAYTPKSGSNEWAMRNTIWRMARLAKALRDSLPAATNGDRRKVLLWAQYPAFGAVAQALNPDLLIADVMDVYGLFRGSPSTGAAAAAQTLRDAAIVFSGGHTIGRITASEAGRDVVTIPSGVDISHFQSACDKRPNLTNIPSARRIGYAGSIDERLDTEVIGGIARRFPNVEIELIGPIRIPESTRRAFLKNVLLPGGCAYSELPMRMASWDAALLPFHDDELCRSLSPTKIPEYLAAGRPVITTPLPDILTDWGDHVRTATTLDEWCEHIEAALETDRHSQPSPALETAMEAAIWDRRFEEILGRVGDEASPHDSN